MSLLKNCQVGACYIYLGPMCSGKTLKVNNELTKAGDIGLSSLRIGHSKDIRETASVDKTNGVTTHNSQFVKMSSKVKTIAVSKLNQVNVEPYQVIGIDEGQFFPDLAKTVKDWVLHQGKIVHIASLDADSNLQLFGQVTELIPIAIKVKKKKAICLYCFKENHPGKPAISTVCRVEKTDQTLVGGLESYSPACLDCYFKHSSTG